MLKVIKRAFPLVKEGEINRLNDQLEEERKRGDDLETALVELAGMIIDGGE